MTTTTASPHPPTPSALSLRLHHAGAKHTRIALPVEVQHNLEFQHAWTDLLTESLPNTSYHHHHPSSLDLNARSVSPNRLRSPSRPSPDDQVRIVSGLPPRHVYLHPDLTTYLVRNGIAPEEVAVQREWALPMSMGENRSLRQFAEIFDALPKREYIRVGEYEHQDAKRVLLAMMSQNGMGGDGTIVYYIMQEGAVKPRQN